MLYLIINEQQVTLCSLTRKGKVQQGIRQESVLYGLAYAFESDLQCSAYAFAQQLVESGCAVLVTVADTYKVWVGLSESSFSHD